MENKGKGFGAISGNGEPYDFYKWRWVEVITQNSTHWGKYRGMLEGYLILNPYVRHESYPSDEKEKRENLFVIVDEPLAIAGAVVNTVGGLREEHVMATVNKREIIILKR